MCLNSSYVTWWGYLCVRHYSSIHSSAKLCYFLFFIQVRYTLTLTASPQADIQNITQPDMLPMHVATEPLLILLVGATLPK